MDDGAGHEKGVGFQVPAGVEAALSFAIQVAIGSLGFLFVYLVALVVQISVHWLNSFLHAPSWMQGVGGALEAFLFAADILGFILFIVSESAKFTRKLLRDWKDH